MKQQVGNAETNQFANQVLPYQDVYDALRTTAQSSWNPETRYFHGCRSFGALSLAALIAMWIVHLLETARESQLREAVELHPLWGTQLIHPRSIGVLDKILPLAMSHCFTWIECGV